MKKPAFADLADLEEDKRIDIIGKAVMKGNTVSVCVDSQNDKEPTKWGKADRYWKKIKERFPKVRLIGRFVGPVPGTVSLKIGPPE